MTTKTLIKKIKNSQLAAVPKKQYEEFLKWQKYILLKPAKANKTDRPKGWKDIKVSWTDFQEAKKAVFDFDIEKYVSKDDFKKWKS